MVEFKVELPEERKKELRESRALLEEIKREIERAERAGADVSELKEKASEVEERLNKLISEYASE